MKAALLLVDLQNDYLNSPGLDPGQGKIVHEAAALLSGCRRHSIPVIHVWTTVTRDDDRRMPHWRQTNRWTCELGTPGHETPPSLVPQEGELVIHKTFFSAFSNPRLEAHLAASGVDTLIIAGIHLHACVRQAALDAYERGFNVVIADNAVGSDDPLHAAITRRYLKARSVKFLSVHELPAAPGLEAAEHDETADPGAVVIKAKRAAGDSIITERLAKNRMLVRLAVLLEDEASELAAQMASDIGKPVRLGKMEVLKSAAMLRAITTRLDRDFDESLSPCISLRRRPHGVVGIITPWNNPVYIPLGKIAPAFLCGNAVVWKPSPFAAAISQRLLELIRLSEFPDGAVNLLQGGRSAAESLMSHPLVDAVSITCSLSAGFSAQEICARRHIPLQAEMGGNNASIIWPDCDLPAAAKQIAEGAFGMAGQRCTANRRVIVHQDCREEFLRLIKIESAMLPSGNPLSPETLFGPLVSERHRESLAASIKRCPPDDVEIISPAILNHSPLSEAQENAWHPAVIVCSSKSSSEIVQEETFGPLLVVQTAHDWSEAISLCNGVRHGLAAALFSRSRETQQRFLREARAGILKLNCSTADAEIDVPFGGWKASGTGQPEHGDFDFEFYTRPQTVYESQPVAGASLPVNCR